MESDTKYLTSTALVNILHLNNSLFFRISITHCQISYTSFLPRPFTQKFTSCRLFFVL